MSGTVSINQATACLALLLMASIASASVHRFHAQPNQTNLCLSNQNISIVNNGTWSGLRNLTILTLRGNFIEVSFSIPFPIPIPVFEKYLRVSLLNLVGILSRFFHFEKDFILPRSIAFHGLSWYSLKSCCER